MEFIVATKAGSIMGPIISLFGYIMDFLFRITSSFGILNLGLCIILFTIITKLLLFPLTIKQQKSSKLMSLMNPEIQAVQKKYKGKKDQTSMTKQQMEMQAIYEKYGSSPTAGCLPMLIQFPIIIALYRVIYNIPAYVPSVRIFFDNVVEPLQKQPDFINKIADVASSYGLAIDKIDYNNADKVVDLLYKFTPSNWQALADTFPQMDPDAPGAQTMNTMMMTMPLVSVFFCFTFPAAIGIYWVVQGAFQIVQQLAVNSYMNKVDMDELIQKNVDKMNKKRAKKGLPPAKVNQNASANLKNIQAQTEKEEQLRNEKLSKIDRQVKESTEFYNSDPKPGSLASKAKMVQKYNEKHNK